MSRSIPMFTNPQTIKKSQLQTLLPTMFVVFIFLVTIPNIKYRSLRGIHMCTFLALPRAKTAILFSATILVVPTHTACKRNVFVLISRNRQTTQATPPHTAPEKRTKRNENDYEHDSS